MITKFKLFESKYDVFKVNDICIYRGVDYPNRVGEWVRILNVNPYGINRNVYHIIFEDGFVSICSGRFLEVCNSKKIKIERPDVDPYGEEDWGYEIK